LLLSSGFIHMIATTKHHGHYHVYILTVFSNDDSPTNIRNVFLSLPFPVVTLMTLISESVRSTVHFLQIPFCLLHLS